MVWEVYEVNPYTGLLFPASPPIVDRSSFDIEPGEYLVGLYYVKFTVQMIGKHGTFSYGYGFFNMTPPQLEAKIQGPQEAEDSEIVVLDASNSTGPNGTEGLNFTWFCRRKDEHFSTIAPLPIDIASGRNETNRGCFGYGVGQMTSRSRVLTFDTRLMEADRDYVFQLLVQNGDSERSIANHNFRVEKSFSVSIR